MSRFAAGKRTLKRIAMNKRLAKMFIERGLPQRCELKLDGCMKTWALQWCHSRKSRFINTDEEWMDAALGCPSCHGKIEAMTHDQMFEHVKEAIGRRN